MWQDVTSSSYAFCFFSVACCELRPPERRTAPSVLLQVEDSPASPESGKRFPAEEEMEWRIQRPEGQTETVAVSRDS